MVIFDRPKMGDRLKLGDRIKMGGLPFNWEWGESPKSPPISSPRVNLLKATYVKASYLKDEDEDEERIACSFAWIIISFQVSQ